MSLDMDAVKLAVEIIPQLVVLTIFFVTLANRVKSGQELSDYKFLINAQRIESLEKELESKIAGNSNRIDNLNQKYDSLNRDVLNKLSEIEKLLARLQGQFHIFDKQSTGG